MACFPVSEETCGSATVEVENPGLTELFVLGTMLGTATSLERLSFTVFHDEIEAC